jgi:hypothetical protein
MDVRNEVAKSEIVHVDFATKPVRAPLADVNSLSVMFALRFHQKAFTAGGFLTPIVRPEPRAPGKAAKAIKPGRQPSRQNDSPNAFTESLVRQKLGPPS